MCYFKFLNSYILRSNCYSWHCWLFHLLPNIHIIFKWCFKWKLFKFLISKGAFITLNEYDCVRLENVWIGIFGSFVKLNSKCSLGCIVAIGNIKKQWLINFYAWNKSSIEIFLEMIPECIHIWMYVLSFSDIHMYVYIYWEFHTKSCSINNCIHNLNFRFNWNSCISTGNR